MEEQRDAGVGGFVAGLLLGALVGAGVALLTAPSSGVRTRRKIRRAADGLVDTAQGRWDDATGELRTRVGRVRSKVEDVVGDVRQGMGR
jgi:gas vesicle protein